MSAKLSKALGKRVTLVGRENAKGQRNAKYESAEKLDELWPRIRDSFGLGDDMDFSVDLPKLLEFIEQQADTRKSFRDLYGSQRQEIIENQAMAIWNAAEEMYSEKTGKRFSLDTDQERDNGVRYSINSQMTGVPSFSDADSIHDIAGNEIEGYSDHQLRNWQNSKNIVVFSNVAQFKQLFKQAKKHITPEMKIYFGRVSDTLADRIKTATGIETYGKNLSLQFYEIEKILNKHGDAATEALLHQRALDVDDFIAIPYIVANANDIRKSNRQYDGKPTITLKLDANPWSEIVAVVSDRRMDLRVQTMYGGIKKSLATQINANALIKTPLANSGTALNNTIPGATPKSNTSTPHSLDTDYLRLAEKYQSGTATEAETQQLQQAVEQAAKDAGYSGKMYHGSRKGGGFTVFRGWQYFTPNEAYAKRYIQLGNPNSMYSVFVKADNYFDTRKAEAKRLFKQYRQEYGLGELQENGLPDWTDGYDLADIIEDNGLNYDGIILDEGGDMVDGEPVARGLSYVIRNSAQIKSADLVTHDDKGNIIPLSERFNTQNPDIRYDLDTDDLRENVHAFTQIDAEAFKAGLEQLKNVTPGKGMFALKDISRFLDTISGGDKELRNTLNKIFEKPHSRALKNYATGVEKMQQRVLDIGQRAGVCDAKGRYFDKKKSAAIRK